jgi:hypothetical protein
MCLLEIFLSSITVAQDILFFFLKNVGVFIMSCTLNPCLPLCNPQDCTFSTAYCTLLFDGHLLILHMLLKYMILIHLVLPQPNLLQYYVRFLYVE